MNEEAKRPWGFYTVIEKTKIICVEPNQKLSLQYHNKRKEEWEIIGGSGYVTIGEKKMEAKKGDKFSILERQIHRIEAGKEGIFFIEKATGIDIDEADIIRLKDDYGRIK